MADNFVTKIGTLNTLEHLIQWNKSHFLMGQMCHDCPFNGHGCLGAASDTLKWFFDKIYPIVFEILPDPILIEKKENKNGIV